MKPRIILLCLGLLLTARAAQAQWVVTDPSNLAQGIINSTKQIVEAARNGSTLLQSFQETVKIYEQGKRYYDALKAVNNLVRSARKVQQCMLLVGEISDIYVNGYQRMVVDDNFSSTELAAIATGYARIIEESAGELKELQDIVNPTDMSLTDKDRIDVVERVYGVLRHHRDLARYYTRKNISISLLRGAQRNDLDRVMDLYGTDEQRYW